MRANKRSLQQQVSQNRDFRYLKQHIKKLLSGEDWYLHSLLKRSEHQKVSFDVRGSCQMHCTSENKSGWCFDLWSSSQVSCSVKNCHFREGLLQLSDYSRALQELTHKTVGQRKKKNHLWGITQSKRNYYSSTEVYLIFEQQMYFDSYHVIMHFTVW